MPSDPGSLDFWLGEWSCTWEGGHGRNRVTKEMDSRVVVERFESLAPERWSGMSVSVFDERHGWRQTWVDSTGNYWALEGSPHTEGFSFAVTDAEEDGPVGKRMVFLDIEPDAFRWRWERSRDDGASWEPLWTIDYRRAEGI
jgi:hypothetical protein